MDKSIGKNIRILESDPPLPKGEIESLLDNLQEAFYGSREGEDSASYPSICFSLLDCQERHLQDSKIEASERFIIISLELDKPDIESKDYYFYLCISPLTEWPFFVDGEETAPIIRPNSVLIPIKMSAKTLCIIARISYENSMKTRHSCKVEIPYSLEIKATEKRA